MTTGAPSVPLIRANINQSPRARLVAQTIPASVNVSNSGITTISANIVSQQNQIPTATQTGQPTFVATVLPPRQQTATLVYSNPQQQFTSTRLAVATPITGQRQVRPIQLTNTRLPTQGIGVRVSTANIRANIPVLAPTSVLSSLPNAVQGRPATLSTSNIASALPATRIIQVQQQPQTGGPQVISTRQIAAGNLMTLHPVIMNTATGTGNRVSSTAKVQPSLTITHVGKLPAGSTQQGNLALATNLSQGTTLTSGNLNQQQLTHQSTTSTPIGIVTSTNPINQGQQQHQIAQIVGINQQGGSHQIVSCFWR